MSKSNLTLFCSNILLFVIGICVIAIGSENLLHNYHYYCFLGKIYFDVALIVVLIGIFTLFVSFYGCCGVAVECYNCQKRKPMIYCYIILLGLIILCLAPTIIFVEISKVCT